MNINPSKFRKSAQFLSTICGGLLMSISAIPQSASAQQPIFQQPSVQPSSQVNPCPRIFYEQPHNNRVAVPQGCPPNAFTQRLIERGLLPQSTVPATPNTEQMRLGVGGDRGSAPGVGQSTFPVKPLPLPSQQQSPSTQIALASGRVNVRLINDSGANVTYQVIGDTSPRSLQGRSDVTLQGLTAPVTLTFQREDGGLLQATTQPSTQSGVLELRLRETTDVGQDKTALRIENNGLVFLN